MEKPTTIHSTFVIERKLKAAPERVFAAFADPATKRRWFFESGHNTLEHHELDFKVGGREQGRIRFGKNAPAPVAGLLCTNDTYYEDIVANQRIVGAYRMSLEGRTFSASLVTIEFVPDGAGTDLFVTHQGAYFEGADGPEMRREGWESLMSSLEKELAA